MTIMTDKTEKPIVVDDMTEEEINADLNKVLNDPKFFDKLYNRDLSKMTDDERAEYYKQAFIATKIKLFNGKRSFK